MRRPVPLVVVLACLLLPGIAGAKIDPACPGASASSAITGVVQNAEGTPVAGLLVELYPSGQTGRDRASKDTAITGPDGRYRVCSGEKSGSHYDTFDVHVRERDDATAPLYATANQAYTTYLNPAGDADFTPASGRPLLYMTNLTITPNATSTLTSSAAVQWVVRSKAPADTAFSLTLPHPTNPSQPAPARTVPMTFIGTEAGGPAAGGWFLWRYDESLPQGTQETTFWATVIGRRAGVEVAQRDTQPYVVDDRPVAFGPADRTVCGDGIHANGFRPTPAGTTNRQPTVTHDVCDPPALSGARSGPDPTSLQGWLCPSSTVALSQCTVIAPVLNARTVIWTPGAPLALGDHYVEFRIRDMAGNLSSSGRSLLRITTSGGQPPTITAPSPGNFGQGATAGIVIGSSLTSPSSIPVIGFRVTDADGPTDIVPGAVDVRVYYGDAPALVYRYDITRSKDSYDPISKAGGGDFDLSTGLFKASGFKLQAKPPGRYVVSVSVTDRGGNNASMSWHFILLAAV